MNKTIPTSLRRTPSTDSQITRNKKLNKTQLLDSILSPALKQLSSICLNMIYDVNKSTVSISRSAK